MKTISELTRHEYIAQQREEMKGFFISDCILDDLSNNYYDYICEWMRAGNSITQLVYDSFTDGQKFHFNKHYNYRGDKING